ncbi:NusB antitermination factor [Stella humosa]|uniref:Transcription antitermination protein NusB n=1 Tax=Stella humosa TaxID=94 RepID=A0A3N1M6H2_9PROT|nr:transcription antitermination factor NusB [Stella humosa]ROQ01442.1 NusB antitermination factor [Stella humosa]BBK31818.1 N utilization substance protein B [Stella humosa]
MTDETPTAPAATGTTGARRSSRLAAVQTLYQMEFTGTSARLAIAEFMRHRLGTTADPTADAGEEEPLEAPDRLLFAAIVEGVKDRTGELDTLIGSALSGEWKVERLEVILRAILRAGTFELLTRPDTAPAIIINDYVDVAHAFFTQKEPGLVNAVLDRLGRRLRQGMEEGRRAGTGTAG